MAINFPASPDFDQVFFDENSGNSYIWDGYAWVGYSTTPFTVTFSANSFEVSNDDVLLGPSTALNFGFGLGAVRGPGVSTITNLYPTQWAGTGAGIHTLSNVGIGTTNATSKLTVRGGDISLGDDEKIILGKDGDFEIYSSGNTYLTNSASNSGGDLRIRSDSTLIQNYTGTETIAQFDSGAGVTLNYSGNTRLTTVPTGVIVGTNAAGVAHIPNELRVGAVAANQSNASILIANSSGVGIGTTNPGEKLQVDGNIRVGISTTSNYIAFRGTYWDGPANTGGELPYQHTYIGERIYDYSGNGERSELLLFKGNDISGADGPDRIRLFAGEHRFDVIGFNTTGTFEQVGVSTAAINKLTITSTGVGIGTTNATSALTVQGTSTLQTLNVSGVSTFNNDVNFIGQTYNAFWDQSLYQGCFKFEDNASLVFGTSDDFRIYYSDFSTKFDGTVLLTGGLSVRTGLGTLAHFGNWSGVGNNVELYFSESKKFETIGAGVTVTGTTFTNQLSVSGVSTFSGNDIDFTHNGSTRAYWDSSAGALEFKDGDGVVFGTGEDARISWDGTDWVFTKSTSAGSIKFLKSTGSENIAVFTNDGSVELYYDNSKKFETLGAGVTVTGTTFTNQLNVSGVSTFNNNVRVSGIVTANSVFVSNDGGDTGSVLIEDVGPYSQISFRSSSGTTQTQIQGVESNLYITPGIDGYIGLSGATTNIFYRTGDVVLNNGLQGTTHAANGLRVTGLTSTTSFNVGTAITATATSGIVTATGGFSSGIGTGVQITTVGNQLIFTVPGVGSTSLTLYP